MKHRFYFIKSILLDLNMVLYVAFTLVTSCNEGKIPVKIVKNTEGVFEYKNGQYCQNGEPLTGQLLSMNAQNDTLALTTFIEGKEDGKSEKWYPNHQKQEERFFKNGKKIGVHKGWWENGQLKFEYHFQNDLHEGLAKEWYQNGQICTVFNYKNGQEEGLQQAWYANGKIKMNYVVRDGRQYGLTGVKNCESVWDITTQKFIEKQKTAQNLH